MERLAQSKVAGKDEKSIQTNLVLLEIDTQSQEKVDSSKQVKSQTYFDVRSTLGTEGHEEDSNVADGSVKEESKELSQS